MTIEKRLLVNESKNLEFKRSLSSLAPILKTIVAFANTAAGILIIGATKGNAMGIKDVLGAEEQLANAITDNIRPTILPEIEVVTVSGKDLIIVKVAHWKAPFYIKREGLSRGAYIVTNLNFSLSATFYTCLIHYFY